MKDFMTIDWTRGRLMKDRRISGIFQTLDCSPAKAPSCYPEAVGREGIELNFTQGWTWISPGQVFYKSFEGKNTSKSGAFASQAGLRY